MSFTGSCLPVTYIPPSLCARHFKGLFRFSRHPNFWAEYSLWWTYYFFSVICANGGGAGSSHPFAKWDQLVNWTGVGALLLTLLFQGSTDLTEKLSVRKYPAYRDYQKRVSMLTPWLHTPPPTKKLH